MASTKTGALIIMVILAVAMIPILATLATVDNDPNCYDATLDTLNVTANLCFDGTNMSQGTEAPTNTYSTPEVILMGLVVLMFIVGLIYTTIRGAGFGGSNLK